jgi:hypothetical protein
MFAIFCLLGICTPAFAQFETRSAVSVGLNPGTIAVGDFNGDRKLDLAVVNSNTYHISVLLGNGDGTFRSSVNYAVGSTPLGIATADLNHDGKLDLVVASLQSVITVLLGNGDGTFQPGTTYKTTAQTLRVEIADLNGDNNPDLVIVDSPYVSVMLGNGDGTFQPVIDASVQGYSPFALGIGDFNHDHRLDLAVGEQGSGGGEVEILLGNGDGTFQPGQGYPVAFTPESIAVADFSGDRKLDMAVASEFGVVTVFLGSGDGTFGSGVEYFPPNRSSTWVAVADFNGQSCESWAGCDYPSRRKC